MGSATEKRQPGTGSIFQRKDRNGNPGLWVGMASVGYTNRGKRRRQTVYGHSRDEVQQKIHSIIRAFHEGRLSEIETPRQVRREMKRKAMNRPSEKDFKTYIARGVLMAGMVTIGKAVNPIARVRNGHGRIDPFMKIILVIDRNVETLLHRICYQSCICKNGKRGREIFHDDDHVQNVISRLQRGESPEAIWQSMEDSFQQRISRMGGCAIQQVVTDEDF